MVAIEVGIVVKVNLLFAKEDILQQLVMDNALLVELIIADAKLGVVGRHLVVGINVILVMEMEIPNAQIR